MIIIVLSLICVECVGVLLARRQVGIRLLPLFHQRLLLHWNCWQTSQQGKGSSLHGTGSSIQLLLYFYHVLQSNQLRTFVVNEDSSDEEEEERKPKSLVEQHKAGLKKKSKKEQKEEEIRNAEEEQIAKEERLRKVMFFKEALGDEVYSPTVLTLS